MRVFVTGASGWIGSAVVPELIGAGHQVVGLARSDASAAALAAAGAEVVAAPSTTSTSCAPRPPTSDGVIHLAFKHDIAFSGGFEDAADADRRAIETFGEALAGSGRPLVIASGHARAGAGTRRDRGRTRPDPRRRPPARALVASAARRSPSPTAASAPRSCGSRRPCTARATTASCRRWSASPATRASPATSATAPTAGPPCTGSTPPGSSGSRWRRSGGSMLHAVADEGVPIRDDRRGRSAGTSACRVASVAPRTRPSTSAGWPASSASTARASSALTRELLGLAARRSPG